MIASICIHSRPRMPTHIHARRFRPSGSSARACSLQNRERRDDLWGLLHSVQPVWQKEIRSFWEEELNTLSSPHALRDTCQTFCLKSPIYLQANSWWKRTASPHWLSLRTPSKFSRSRPKPLSPEGLRNVSQEGVSTSAQELWSVLLKIWGTNVMQHFCSGISLSYHADGDSGPRPWNLSGVHTKWGAAAAKIKEAAEDVHVVPAVGTVAFSLVYVSWTLSQGFVLSDEVGSSWFQWNVLLNIQVFTHTL